MFSLYLQCTYLYFCTFEFHSYIASIPQFNPYATLQQTPPFCIDGTPLVATYFLFHPCFMPGIQQQ
jgi:hypothetical protein